MRHVDGAERLIIRNLSGGNGEKRSKIERNTLIVKAREMITERTTLAALQIIKIFRPRMTQLFTQCDQFSKIKIRSLLLNSIFANKYCVSVAAHATRHVL